MFEKLVSDCENFTQKGDSTDLSGFIVRLGAEFSKIEAGTKPSGGTADELLGAVSAAITKRTQDSNLKSEVTASAANLAEKPKPMEAQQEVRDLAKLKGYLEFFRLTKNKRTERILILLRALFRENVLTALKNVFPDQTHELGFDYKLALLHLHPDSVQGFVLPVEIGQKLGEAFFQLKKIKEVGATSENEEHQEELANCSLFYPVAPVTTDEYDPNFPLTFDHLIRACYESRGKSEKVELNHRLSFLLEDRLRISKSWHSEVETSRIAFLKAMGAIISHDLKKLEGVIEGEFELRQSLLTVNRVGRLKLTGGEVFNPPYYAIDIAEFSLLQIALAVNNIPVIKHLLRICPEALFQKITDANRVGRSILLYVESFEAFAILLMNLFGRGDSVDCMAFLQGSISQKDEEHRSLVSRIFQSDKNWPLADRITFARVLANFIQDEIFMDPGLRGRQYSSVLDDIARNKEPELEPIITQLLIHARVHRTSKGSPSTPADDFSADQADLWQLATTVPKMHAVQLAKELPEKVAELRQEKHRTSEVKETHSPLVTALLEGNDFMIQCILRDFRDLFVRLDHNGLSPIEQFLFEACIKEALVPEGQAKQGNTAFIIGQMQVINTLMPESQRPKLWEIIKHNVVSSGSLRPGYSGERKTYVFLGRLQLEEYKLPPGSLTKYQKYVDEIFAQFFKEQGNSSKDVLEMAANGPKVPERLVEFLVQKFGNYAHTATSSDEPNAMSKKAVVALCCMPLESVCRTRLELVVIKVIVANALKTQMMRPFQEQSRLFKLNSSDQKLLQELVPLTEQDILNLLRFIAKRFTNQFLPEIVEYRQKQTAQKDLSLSMVCAILAKNGGLKEKDLPDLLEDKEKPGFLGVVLYWYTLYVFGEINLETFRKFSSEYCCHDSISRDEWMKKVLSNNHAKLKRMFSAASTLALTASAAPLPLTGSTAGTKTKKENIGDNTALRQLGLMASAPTSEKQLTPEELLVQRILKVYKRYDARINLGHTLEQLLEVAKSVNIGCSDQELIPVLVKAAIFETTSVNVDKNTKVQDLYDGFNAKNSAPSLGS